VSVHRTLRNQSLDKSIHDAAWNQFADRLSYKAAWAGRKHVAVNPAYPSQDCSGFGHRQSLTLADRIYACPSCGLEIDRGLSASRNIARRGDSLWFRPRNLMPNGMGSRHVYSLERRDKVQYDSRASGLALVSLLRARISVDPGANRPARRPRWATTRRPIRTW
jgi:hypothetical protein